MIKLLKFLVLGLLAAWFLGSCGPDTTGSGEPLPERPAIPQYPTLTFIDSVGILSSDAFISPSDTFFVRLRGQKGDSAMLTLKISANQQPLATERIITAGINGNTVNNSVITISGPDQDEFLWDLGIIAQPDSSKVIYQFVLKDTTGRTDILDILINSKITNITPPNFRLVGQSIEDTLTFVPVVFDLELDAIGAPIKALAVYQGAEIVEKERLKFDGVPFAANPLDLEGSDRLGFTKALEIRGNGLAGTQGYTVVYQDSINNKFYQELAFNAIRRVELEEGIMLAKDSLVDLKPKVNGIIDGALTDYSDIADVGSLAGNWRKQIAGVNNTELRQVLPTQGVVFDDIIGENKVEEAWDGALRFMVNDTLRYAMDTIPVNVSSIVRVDDLFLAQNDSTLYLLRIKEVNDENDFYIFDMKY